ncbi:MAG: Mur ligase family protein [Candidatus Aminicenantes bacterium]|nr:Mur ligase family protein [Candidatus Aminicenantes bacterium]
MSHGPASPRPPGRPLTPSQSRDYLRALERFGVKLGLDNIRVLLRTLGGRMIGRPEFGRLLGLIRAAIEDLMAAGRLDAHPTYFEVLTTLACLYFAARKVDIAVLEVGLGGRFDATNVVTPLVSVITSISLDHREHLGDTLGAIAFEKAGIIKSGIPVVCGPDQGAALKVIKARAAELEAPFRPVFGRGRELLAAKDPAGIRFRYTVEGEAYEFVPGLRGEHQGLNAATAIAVLRELDRLGRGPSRKAVIEGIESVRWEGRLEVVGRKPTVILDGAHNEDGAKALSRYVRDEIRGPLVLVFAMMKDKAVRRSARHLFSLARRVILTTIPFTRAEKPEAILRALPEFKRKIVIEPDLGLALALARRLAGPTGTVLVAGSLPRLRRRGYVSAFGCMCRGMFEHVTIIENETEWAIL